MNLIAESIDRMDDDLDGELLASVGLEDDSDSRAALAEIASTPVPADLFRRLRSRLDVWLPKSSDPAFALKSLQRFISASRSPTALLALFERDERALPTLLKLLSAGERLTRWLIDDPEAFDLVRASDGRETSRATLVDEIIVELEALSVHGNHRDAATQVLRSVYGRERLRIAYAEFVNQTPPARVAEQLSVLSDAIIESAVQFVRTELVLRYGEPRTPDAQPGRFAVIGLGPLGGNELHYDSSLDLLFLRDLCEPTDGRINLPADEFFDLLAKGVLNLLGGRSQVQNVRQSDEKATGLDDFPLPDLAVEWERLDGAGIYDVASSHRPRTDAGSLALTTTEAHRHYQLMGRTWERLLYVKSRCVAGDAGLGSEFLSLMEPWIYRRYLDPADIEGLHTLARKISRRVDVSTQTKKGLLANAEPIRPLEVLSVPGGLNDIDAVIGLLQLINGGELPSSRPHSTIEAIEALRVSECLSLQEATLLSGHYDLLRRSLHCLQAESASDSAVDNVASFDRENQQARIAWQLGFKNQQSRGDVGSMNEAIDTALRLNRTAIGDLMQEALKDSEPFPIETELILDPDPDESLIRTAMARHRMTDPLVAMRDLQRLADEPVPFLSSRRCRHHLATIAPPLLSEIGRTPDPHATLSTLVDVSDSLGGKAVLWELFRAAPPTMHLMVRLCACGPYLASILIRNPGMIDELVDSLLLDRLPTERWLEASSTELCRGAFDVDPVIASFKDASHLQIGVRDVLGKDSLAATHGALATTAESVLRRIAEDAMRKLCDRFGDPLDANGQEIEFVMLGLGKLGAREPNYRSDLDVIFLYSAEGNTRRRVGGHRTTTTAAFFFNELAREISRRVNASTDGVRLYELGTSLSLGNAASTTAAISIDAFHAYFRRGEAGLLQRLTLCNARPLSGSPAIRANVNQLLADVLTATEWYPLMATHIRELRFALEQDAGDDNLKRAAGGSVDVEWISQSLQLRHASQHPHLLGPGTTESLQRFADAGLLDATIATALVANYRMLREVESKLCLLATPGRHEIPDDPQLLELLAFLMDESNGSEIMARCRECRASNRRMFNQLFQELSQ